ncbi:hypothetical protein [Metaplanococcus flavidus]|uniref:NADH dehydrogenase subunit 4L n=1 Tax=Metaplanococcus flavidus TaxID=569883 RepID=A0ABW3LFC8_9BACL
MEAKPLKISYAFIILLVLNWILFLSGFYTIFTHEVGDLLWEVAWVGVCLMGAIVGVMELWNNKLVGILIFIITMFTTGFVLLSFFIGSM